MHLNLALGTEPDHKSDSRQLMRDTLLLQDTINICLLVWQCNSHEGIIQACNQKTISSVLIYQYPPSIV